MRMSEIGAGVQAEVRLTLNGAAQTGKAEARTLLSDFLRDGLGATDVHVGCEHGVCGCCTVLIDGVAVRSCLTLAVQADGARVETAASLAGSGGQLNGLQAAFREHHALQCGFCTPGILMSLTDLLQREPAPSRERVVDVVSGHLCRCTGYSAIVDAAMAAVAAMRGAPPV
jgi:2-furoyl-CoA dehydrogenase 2Fe-2S iron sulfur subunit